MPAALSEPLTWIQELFRKPDAISDRFVTKLETVHCGGRYRICEYLATEMNRIRCIDELSQAV